MSRRIARTMQVLVILMTLVLAASPARAQQREGFFFGVGLGYGSLDITCDGCELDREGALSGHLRLGGAISEKFLLGVESTGWYKDEDGVTLTSGTLTLNGYLYPSENGGFFLKGGLGLGVVDLEVDFLGSDSDTGFGWQVGAGYDLPIGTKTALTPTLTYFRTHMDGYGTNVFQLALAISLY